MKTSLVLLPLFFILVACVPSPPNPTTIPLPTSTLVPITEPTAEPTIFFPATEYIPSPTATPLPFHGYLQFPFLNADAGNFQLQTGATITFTWTDAPLDAEYYEFVIYPLDGSPSIVLGTDTDSSDGVALQWIVLPGIAAELHGLAYYAVGESPLRSISSTIYSPVP